MESLRMSGLKDSLGLDTLKDKLEPKVALPEPIEETVEVAKDKKDIKRVKKDKK